MSFLTDFFYLSSKQSRFSNEFKFVLLVDRSIHRALQLVGVCLLLYPHYTTPPTPPPLSQDTMLSVVLETLLLNGIPNDFIIANLTCAAAILGAGLPRFIFFLERKNKVERLHNVLLSGLSCLRIISLILLVATSFLLGRSTITSPRDFWSIQSLNKGYWCVLRTGIVLLLVGAMYLFDKHPLLRLVALLLAPVSGAIDYFSQVDMVNTVSCMNTGTCVEKSLDWQYFFIYRDMISGGLTVRSPPPATLFW
jgi:hypothetical protein